MTKVNGKLLLVLWTSFVTANGFLALPSMAQAALPLAPLKIFVQPGDRVAIKGYRGALDYIVKKDATDVTVELQEISAPTPFMRKPTSIEEVNSDNWQFSFHREGSTIMATVEGPATKQKWSEIVQSHAIPNYRMRVTGPALPLDVNWNEGTIRLDDLSAEIHVTMLKGEVFIDKGEGDISVSNQEGLVRLKDRKGQINIDSYQARIEIENLEGRLDLENFTGESKVQNINGNVNLVTYKGTTNLAQVTGRLDFRNGNSPLRIENFEGELRGHSGQGSIFADIKGEADIRLESGEGAVNLRLPASNAWVNLGTADGHMAVPTFLKLVRLPSQQIRTGKLRGGSTGGNIFVRTRSGDIRIR